MLIYQLAISSVGHWKYQSDCELERALQVLWEAVAKLVFASDAEQWGQIGTHRVSTHFVFFLIDTPYAGGTVGVLYQLIRLEMSDHRQMS